MGSKQGHLCVVLFFFLEQGFHFLSPPQEVGIVERSFVGERG